jgi:hypothetical protein
MSITKTVNKQKNDEPTHIEGGSQLGIIRKRGLTRSQDHDNKRGTFYRLVNGDLISEHVIMIAYFDPIQRLAAALISAVGNTLYSRRRKRLWRL